ncbi:DUF4255 domain-containing protein [Achromobacter deleyi]|uniref:DUF4255 domain-containing protein n=1 Tax=Achromobacter deleyi TaxID=1353891 RepID=UPI001490E237|nr:DUF4255 domain-containing protein [Achromobacter deleyi]QVQ26401.1 DUF4255 domain-containing protein [Achromobacter deleyi]UIP21965.1 DUF4255 domain-containing protein [Achromobacter deleyi]
MSNALAIAAVTAVLKDLLDSGLIDHAVTDALGAGVKVSALAPDAVSLDNQEDPQLNLFLHQVTPNAAWRNAALPSRDPAGERIANPPLALDLHYLLTAYGRAELQAEVLLGYALQLLHESPVLPREAVRRALDPDVVDGAILPTVYQSLRSADLASQVELLKITPAALGAEEMSRLWSALHAHYRPTAAFQVSVVLIESRRPARGALPVLTRGERLPGSPRDRGVLVFPGLKPPLPTLLSVQPAGKQPVAVAGGTVTLLGHHLDGLARQVLLRHSALQAERSVSVDAGTDTWLRLTMPADLPVGVYRIHAALQTSDTGLRRDSNQLALVLAPEPVLPPVSATRNAGTVRLALAVTPPLLAGQSASLLLGDRELPAEPHTAPASQLVFEWRDAPPAGTPFLARLRVDGIESPLVDREAVPVRYLNRQIELP